MKRRATHIGAAIALVTAVVTVFMTAQYLGWTMQGIEIVREAQAVQKPPRDNIINGELYPQGYTPMKIKNGVYPRDYYPNTERLGPKEMRVIALGTGMPNEITGYTTSHCQDKTIPPSIIL